MTRQAETLTEDETRTVPGSVTAPEIGMNIVDLGLVYDVEISANRG